MQNSLVFSVVIDHCLQHPILMNAKSPMLRVAIVEDQAALRESLVECLQNSRVIQCLGACASAEEAVVTLPQWQVDVVFMDVNLPGDSGVRCVQQLAPMMPHTIFVMLTAYDDADAVFQSLQAGACGYLLKPVRAKHLEEAAREVVAGGSPMSAKIARMVVQSFSKPAMTKEKLPADAALTAREKSILDSLVAGYLYKEISDQLQISEHTVHFHIRNIYKKLQVQSRAQAVAKVIQQS